MANPNFYADINVLNCILKMEFDEPETDIDLTIDIINLPLWFSFRSDEKNQTLTVYTQPELYTRNEKFVTSFKKGSLVLDRATGQAKVEAIEALQNNMGAFFAACRNISRLIIKENLQPLYAELDPEQAGILLTEEDGEVHWNVVKGVERPELTIQTMFGGITKGRPYMEDFWDRSEKEMMSLEEKIEAAENGDVDLMMDLAQTYLNGDEDEDEEIEPDAEKSFYWFRKAADEGNQNAMFNVGLFYAKGFGVERDFAVAADWMEKAADAGDEDAPGAAELYRKASESIAKAKAGDVEAAAELASIYMSIAGSLEQAGTGDDYEESLRWAKIAADAGHPVGYYTLGLAYNHGRGVKQNEKKAAEYYKKGADLGHPDSMCNFAVCILNGNVPDMDDEDAFTLMLKSAELGYPQAMYNVGRAYQFGTGVDDDMRKAIEWYEKYLEVNPDPELEQKVSIFKMIEKNGFDLTDEDEDAEDEADVDSDETDSADFYAEMNKAAEAFIALDEFVEKRAPEYGRQIDTNDTDGQKSFLKELAQQGDPEAISLLEQISILFAGEDEDEENT